MRMCMAARDAGDSCAALRDEAEKEIARAPVGQLRRACVQQFPAIRQDL